MDTVFVASGLFAILVVASVRPVNWTARMGTPKWEMKESWASTLTVVGAIVGGALPLVAALPAETSPLTKREFASLSLFFGASPIIAGFLYNATRRPPDVVVDPPQYQGYVWTFVVAAIVTVWAASGQVVTLFLLLGQLRVQGSMTALTGVAFQGLLGLVAIAMIPYVRHAVQNAIATGDPRIARARLKAQGATCVTVSDVALPDWPML